MSQYKRQKMRWIVLLLAGFALVGAACSNSGDKPTALEAGDPGNPSADEVFLEPTDQVGENNFTDSVAVARVGGVGDTEAAGESTSAGIRSVRGNAPGLYGGSGSQVTCDPTSLVAFLQQDEAKAKAWVDALNADPTLSWAGGSKLTVDDIAAYVGELTAVFLQADTRVTNHGFKNGKPVAIQSVLQQGTAVLVDKQGVPRVRCACGNPLLPPKTVTGPKYRGTTWKGFDAKKVIVVVRGPKVETLRIVDIHTREIIEIYTGTGCVCDRKIPTPSTTTTTVLPDQPVPGKKTTTTTIRRPKTSTTIPQGQQQPDPDPGNGQQPQVTTTTSKKNFDGPCYDQQQNEVPCL